MPKNRHRSATNAPGPSSQKLAEDSSPALSKGRFALIALSLIVAIVTTGMLSFDALGLGELPGCGADAACQKASESVFGKVPVVDWPVAFLGFAYYVAMALSALLLRGRFNTPFKAISVLGALSSLFYVVVMALNLDEYLCVYCLVSHAANFVFTGAVLTIGVRTNNTLAPLPTLAAFAGAFAISTGGLAGVKAFSDGQKAEQLDRMAEDDTQRIIDRARGNNESETDEGAVVTTEGDTTPVNVPSVTEIAAQHPDLPGIAYRTDDRGFTGRFRLGPKSAKIRIVMFSDYGCKACRIVSEEIKEIMALRDDVSYSHKHYPFDKTCNPRLTRTVHQKSCEAAQIAEAVGELHGPAAFWRFHFGFYDKIAKNEPFTGVSLIDELGLPGRDTALYARDSDQVKINVADDVLEAYALGLTRTPTVFINGIEFRSWGVRGNLTKRVVEIADQIAPATAEADTPLGAADKYITDFREVGRALPDMGDDPRVSSFGPETAPVEMQIFFGYETDELAEHLLGFEELRALFPDELRIVFRHYAWNERCNFHSNRNRPNNSCVMHHALESAAILGGNEAFQAAYLWMLDNLNSFDESRVPELADFLGLDPVAFQRSVDSPQVQEEVFADATWLNTYPKRRAAKPQVFINNKRLERWEVGDDRVSVIAAIIREQLAAGTP